MPIERTAQRIHDILKNIASVETYTKGLEQEAFFQNQMAVDAVERCLERIAEACRKLGARFDAEVGPDIDLHGIRQFGSVLRHNYDAVDTGIVWNVIAGDLPKLKSAFEILRKDHPLPAKQTDPDFDPF